MKASVTFDGDIAMLHRKIQAYQALYECDPIIRGGRAMFCDVDGTLVDLVGMARVVHVGTARVQLRLGNGEVVTVTNDTTFHGHFEWSLSHE